MYKKLCFIYLFFLATSTFANAKTEGYLLIKVQRHAYSADKQPDGSVKRETEDLEQAYKVPLSTEFLAQFKNLPSQNSMGTGFHLAGRSQKVAGAYTGFTWWLHRTNSGKLSINMWAQGNEEIKNQIVMGRNPVASQYITLPNWQSLDMTYALSYSIDFSGVNYSFSVKYVAADDPELTNIPLAEIRRADRNVLIAGEKPQCEKLLVTGGFQEG